jgi:hypothetical protein
MSISRASLRVFCIISLRTRARTAYSCLPGDVVLVGLSFRCIRARETLGRILSNIKIEIHLNITSASTFNMLDDRGCVSIGIYICGSLSRCFFEPILIFTACFAPCGDIDHFFNIINTQSIIKYGYQEKSRNDRSS